MISLRLYKVLSPHRIIESDTRGVRIFLKKSGLSLAHSKISRTLLDKTGRNSSSCAKMSLCACLDLLVCRSMEEY